MAIRMLAVRSIGSLTTSRLFHQLYKPLNSSIAPASAFQLQRAAATMAAGASENWEHVLDILSSLIKNKTRADGKTWRDAHENMPVYLRRLHMEDRVQKLNVVHIAGTKGKGSTCAMVESILRTAGYSTGMFTSPHLCDVRERVRLNGAMVSKAVFAAAFWKCYNTLKDSATDVVGMPGYFRFLTLLALQIFIDAKPDVIILEVGIGGRIDATNILAAPAVTGISSLGFDHMELLGNTLDLIAREKAGIMRPNVPCFTVPQPPEAMMALQDSAAAVGAILQIAPSLAQYQHTQPGHSISFGLAGEHQLLNASLAAALAQCWEQRNLHRLQAANSSSGSNNSSTGTSVSPVATMTGADAVDGAARRLEQLSCGVLPQEYCDGLSQAAWPGRSQILPHPKFARSDSGGSSRLAMYLDGAHTPESMVACASWFADVSRQQAGQQHAHQPPSTDTDGNDHGLSSCNTAARFGTRQPVRVLIFNCMKERDPAVLLPELHKELQQQAAPIQLALFVPPDSQYAFLPTSSTQALMAAAHQDLHWQQQLQGVWQQCSTQSPAAVDAGRELQAQSALLPPLPEVPGRGVQDVSRGSAVLSSVGQALHWLEQAAEAQPELQIHVLVTGSLYLVGDCLKALESQPQ